ncbi:nitrogen fixation protein FixH [Limnohabitans sp.]|uniref:nitrogen fixation protein FixH n=1 Tax=Limnohabitans sp. TaxID=1907725 RepID=UPI0037BF7089
MSNSSASKSTNHPWWSYGHVWLVISGPMIVVVASFITFYLAAHGQDPVLTQYNGEADLKTQDARTTLAPAMQARNHAATGTLPSPDSNKKP